MACAVSWLRRIMMCKPPKETERWSIWASQPCSDASKRGGELEPSLWGILCYRCSTGLFTTSVSSWNHLTMGLLGLCGHSWPMAEDVLSLLCHAPTYILAVITESLQHQWLYLNRLTTETIRRHLLGVGQASSKLVPGLIFSFHLLSRKLIGYCQNLNTKPVWKCRIKSSFLHSCHNPHTMMTMLR